MDRTNDVTAGDGASTDEQARKRMEWATRMAEMDRQWKAHREREAALLPLNKVALFEALATAGIGTVIVSFDGSGDSGQIEDVTALSGDSQPAKLPAGLIDYREARYDADEPTMTRLTATDVLEHLSYAFLNSTHGGWENDDGAYGEFTFDVAAQAITLEYNERYTATNYHCHEF